jgi:dolichol-phosphate mannosyltransferase
MQDSPSSGSSPYLSVVVPIFDEEANVEPLVREVGAALAGIDYELLLIDDGSRDGSAAVASRLMAGEPRLRVLRHDRNYGMSAAYLTGFRAARAEIVATLDGDLQNDPADLPRLLAELDRGNDLVCGIRQRRRDTWVKRASSRLANRVRSAVLGDGVVDTGCSLKVYRARFLRDLPAFRGLHRFLPALAMMQGARIAQVPVNHRPRRSGKSKFGIGNRLGVGIADLLGVLWLQRRRAEAAGIEELPRR